MARCLILLLLLAPGSLFAAATSNTASCDIGVTPAATLLLPYFEVDANAPIGTGSNTLFTITNTSRYPQIAHVMLWTDWAYPVLSFDLFLTGYDVQGVNLYDVIVRGQLVPTTAQASPGSPLPNGSLGGHTPSANDSNPHFVTDGSSRDVRTSCAPPPSLPVDVALAVKNALVTGTGYVSSAASCGTAQIGFNHGVVARGYATVDVVSYCGSKIPATSAYFAGPDSPLLFDNVLLGDYQQLGPTPAASGSSSTFDAAGGPMVHIRAMPEGGLSGASGGAPVATNLPFTFYDRYTPAGARTADRRQPLPTEWAARYIQGGARGFATDFKIWREGVIGPTTSCAAVQDNYQLVVRNIIRFDEHDNAYAIVYFGGFEGCCQPPMLPPTSRLPSTNFNFPVLTGIDVGGWMYFDLNSEGQTGYYTPHNSLSAQRPGFNTLTSGAPLGTGGSRTQTQAWVISSMFGAVGANRLSVDFDAAWLGNGCTPDKDLSSPIRPLNHSGGALVCPNNTGAGCSPLTHPAAVNP